ncbi:MAG: M23 family metallopeptidase [Cyanobacteria bacterium J06635_1]
MAAADTGTSSTTGSAPDTPKQTSKLSAVAQSVRAGVEKVNAGKLAAKERTGIAKAEQLSAELKEVRAALVELQGAVAAPKGNGIFWPALGLSAACLTAVLLTDIYVGMRSVIRAIDRLPGVDITERPDERFAPVRPTTSTPVKEGDLIAGYEVTSGFGSRVPPCPGCSEYHPAVDLATPIGTQVYAPYAATVECRANAASGNMAHIKPKGVEAPEFLLLHLSECKPGQKAAGELVAETGDTGKGTGPHLDWRQLEKGEYVRPAREWLEIALGGTDAQALRATAARLGLDPVELGALISFESAGTFDPNQMGGDGGLYKGLIQFSPENQEHYDTGGYQSFVEQLPAVERYLLDRGFRPGDDIGAAYAAVLTGRADGSRSSQDSNGTSVSSAIKEFKPGGAHHRNAQQFLGIY